MHATLATWGGSTALRLPKKTLEALGLAAGASVELSVEQGRLIVTPAPPRYDLAQMVDAAKECTPPAFIEDDGAVGSEQW